MFAFHYYVCYCSIFSLDSTEQRPIQSKLTWITKEEDDAKKHGLLQRKCSVSSKLEELLWHRLNIQPMHCVCCSNRDSSYFTGQKNEREKKESESVWQGGELNAFGNLKMYSICILYSSTLKKCVRSRAYCKIILPPRKSSYFAPAKWAKSKKMEQQENKHEWTHRDDIWTEDYILAVG